MSLNWGNYPSPVDNRIEYYRGEPELATNAMILPYGNGRSYGDVCLNDNGTLLSTKYWDNFISFDREQGLLTCQAGVTLADILQVIDGSGWFLPVLPGTKYVSIGGAIANDIHGKNHHRHGSIGKWIRQFGLLRSDQAEVICSTTSNVDLFVATIGGLGLTGLITWAEIQLVKVSSPTLSVTKSPFTDLSEFFKLNDKAIEKNEYTVAWIDCQAAGSKLGRGVFMAANHIEDKEQNQRRKPSSTKLTVPFFMPSQLLNRSTMQAFNSLYYLWNSQKRKSQQHYEQFFFPLDAIGQWNKLYGKAGFLQYQCVIPPTNREKNLQELLEKIVASGQGSFLSVLKTFSDKQSPGLLSFPKEGVTLALDFSNKGESTYQLFKELDEIVFTSGGRVYPAKDARMSPTHFQQSYPNWQKFQSFIDPQCNSNFWRRVSQEAS